MTVYSILPQNCFHAEYCLHSKSIRGFDALDDAADVSAPVVAVAASAAADVAAPVVVVVAAAAAAVAAVAAVVAVAADYGDDDVRLNH